MPVSASSAFIRLTCMLLLLLHQPRPASSADVRHKTWFIPTRLTARLPCLVVELLTPGRSIDQEHGASALYRWVQENGNVIGSGYYQTVRLLRMPANSHAAFFAVQLVCMMYDWASESHLTSVHEIQFYEGPTVTAAVTVAFSEVQNFTDFVTHLDTNDFTQAWCRSQEGCIQAMVASVRSPELEYPRLFDSAAAFDRTPLTDLLQDLKQAATTGRANEFLFNVNFVARLSLSNKLDDLCNPRLPSCSRRLLKGRQEIVMQFSEATVEALDKFAEQRATARKLLTPDQSLTQQASDVLNFTLRLTTISLCPVGYGPADLTSQDAVQRSHEHRNGTAIMCLACHPGSHGPNGLNCFDVPHDYFSEEYGAIEITACPDFYVTQGAGAKSRNDCVYNGTLPEVYVMVVMRYAWEAIELVFHGNPKPLATAALMLYVFVSAYAVFWQLHKLVTLMQFNRRRGMSDRLLKRFIAEAYLRDLRRLQYWRAALDAADAGMDEGPVDMD